MLSLETLDLSRNNFSGLIPKSLENIRYLKYFNVSYNKLRGEIPTGGPFDNFTGESFVSNEGLCGATKFNVPSCPDFPARRQKLQHKLVIMIIVLGVLAGLATVALVLYFGYRKREKVEKTVELLTLERVSYYQLLHATNRYHENNLLGSGSFGSVYKGTLSDGRAVAVKVFKLELEGTSGSFEAECQILSKIRHRNLLKIISACFSPDFKALVLELMPNGSLDKWLHSESGFSLNIMQRLDIMIDVASALNYLHYGCSPPVVHSDLKPSNVLLDEDMVAHVGDFGIAKLLNEEESIMVTKTLATIGYMAPEYGSRGVLSTKCDVYSYGIMLLEVFTGRKPTDDMLVEDLSLRNWVNDSSSESFVDVLDEKLLGKGERHFNEKLDCVAAIIRVALNCSIDSPRERSTIEDALESLKKIKIALVNYCR